MSEHRAAEVTLLNSHQSGCERWRGTFYTTAKDKAVNNFGSSPASLASSSAEGIDPLAILEDASLGFQLGNRTVFKAVKRLLPWEQIVSYDGRHSVVAEEADDPPTSVLDCLSEQVCKAFTDGAALELTGGLDSRLLLAAGLRCGIQPKLSFTIGDTTTPDAHAASAIAEQYGFQHLVIPLVVEPDRIKQDAIDFIRNSGYAANAACYAWLPGTLAALDGKRTAQISGNGGEMAGSFYYTPFDASIEPLRLQSLWVTMRLKRPWIDCRQLWEDGLWAKMDLELQREAISTINETTGSWRKRVDAFYRNGRIGRWAVPVLEASNAYYKVVAPYLSPAYYAWAKSLPVAQRVRRQAQRELLKRAHPGLEGFSLPGSDSSPKSPLTLAGKVLRRLRRSKRASPLGTRQSAIVLAREPEIRGYVLDLLHNSDAGFSRASLEFILDHPEEQPELLGTVVTAAVAWHDLQQHKFRHTNDLKAS